MKTILSLAVLITLSLAGICQTSIPSGSVSGIWTRNGSPYLMQGSIMIPVDSTLIIQGGTTLVFPDDCKLLVLGRLLAIGTSEDSIFFTAANSSIGWRGIRFDNTALSGDTSRLEFCNIQYGTATGNNTDAYGGAILINNFSKISLSHSNLNTNSATYGGAIAVIECNPVIVDNSITDNSAEYGGGLYFTHSSPLIARNTIARNNATNGGGGGILCSASSPEISENNILDNSANAGGGIYCSEPEANPLISRNTVSGNIARGYNGGGIYLDAGSTGTVILNLITHNTAGINGGGIVCFANNPGPEILYNIITHNSANNGGGIQCYPESNPIITGNIIVKNSASSDGGGIAFSSSAILTCNTLAYNSSGNKGSSVALTGDSNPVFRNCILYNDTATYPPHYDRVPNVYLQDESCDPDFYFCDLARGKSGFSTNGNFYTGTYTGNIDGAPLFKNAGLSTGTSFVGMLGDWSLTNDSPCINSGDPSGDYPDDDIAGNPRIFGTRIDMGALEYQLAVGTSEFPLSQAKGFYPNPFSQETILELPVGTKFRALDIYNGLGQKLRTIPYQSGNRIKISRGDLGPGIYLYRLEETSGKVSTGKLMITNQ